MSEDRIQLWYRRAQSALDQLLKYRLLRQVRELFRFKISLPAITKTLIFLAGALATVVSMSGILLGYVRAYNVYMLPYGIPPRLHKLPKVFIVAMILGGILMWVLILSLLKIITLFVGPEIFRNKEILVFAGINLSTSMLAYALFRRWRNGMHNMLTSTDAHGTGSFGSISDLEGYNAEQGLYIGYKLTVSKKTNLITFASARSGKGTGLIIPNILSIKGYTGSICLIDIKAEAAAVCARLLRKMGKKVVILNPWNVLGDILGESDTYNPLDLFRDKSSPNLSDMVTSVAEMICPIKPNDHNSFFTDSGRNVIAGLLLHLVTTDKIENPTLTTLWEWCRLFGEDWDNLLADMSESDDPLNGHAIRNAANEIAKMSGSPETFSSIISNVLESTAFLKSGPLQKGIVSGFDPYTLADGNTVVFVILPADLVAVQGRYLRLVYTTMLRSVINKANDRVTFILDEAAALGYISEVPVSMASYPGFNVITWLIFQDMPQLQDIYGGRWESLIANAGVKHYFGISDLTTATYVSKMMGKETRVVYKRDALGFVYGVETSERDLATPDEVVRGTREAMIVFTGGNHPVMVGKIPYYEMPELKDAEGNNLYELNPYEKESK